MGMRDLGATATAVLTAFSSHLEQLDILIPERRYVAPGSMIPWDGEQLVVNLQTLDQGQPGAPEGGSFVPIAINMWVQFAVAIVREIPALNGEAPLPQMIPDSPDLNEAGLFAMTDAIGLVTAAIDIGVAHELVGPGEGYVVGPCSAVGPEGGLAGHRLLLTLSVS